MEKSKEQKGIETDESRKELAKNGIELNKKDKPKMEHGKHYGLRKVIHQQALNVFSMEIGELPDIHLILKMLLVYQETKYLII